MSPLLAILSWISRWISNRVQRQLRLQIPKGGLGVSKPSTSIWIGLWVEFLYVWIHASDNLDPNQYTCASCGNTFRGYKQLSMKHLPPVRNQLKRFEHTTTASTKIDTLVKESSELDMTPHIYTID
ncbi:hypothetical protein BSLG_001903 [Batrachochytrium salamandrivorans]|nr:hypothetical protein BSLG_001903 [Batrachochytrium salamandrivorans]